MIKKNMFTNRNAKKSYFLDMNAAYWFLMFFMLLFLPAIEKPVSLNVYR